MNDAPTTVDDVSFEKMRKDVSVQTTLTGIELTEILSGLRRDNFTAAATKKKRSCA